MKNNLEEVKILEENLTETEEVEQKYPESYETYLGDGMYAEGWD